MVLCDGFKCVSSFLVRARFAGYDGPMPDAVAAARKESTPERTRRARPTKPVRLAQQCFDLSAQTAPVYYHWMRAAAVRPQAAAMEHKSTVCRWGWVVCGRAARAGEGRAVLSKGGAFGTDRRFDWKTRWAQVVRPDTLYAVRSAGKHSVPALDALAARARSLTSIHPARQILLEARGDISASAVCHLDGTLWGVAGVKGRLVS